ncbi:hypothetical protein F8196_09180 [Corynebacterium matruchotii]|nr:hypothetical protein F8196_09180 [Corynebacterium matruchotii]
MCHRHRRLRRHGLRRRLRRRLGFLLRRGRRRIRLRQLRQPTQRRNDLLHGFFLRRPGFATARQCPTQDHQ